MSHHLDSPLARQDPRLDITDLYVFRGESGTVFVSNHSHSLAGADIPRGLHPEGRYEFNVDFDGDAIEDVTYRLVFDARDATGDQGYRVVRLSGSHAVDDAAEGVVIGAGKTGSVTDLAGGGRAWVGEADDPFWIEPTVLHAVGKAFHDGAVIDLADWSPREAVNLFAGHTVYSIVLEVPDQELRGAVGATRGEIGVWALASLATDSGGWRPINRAGLPMIHPLFTQLDEELGDKLNTTVPAEDRQLYAQPLTAMVASLIGASGTAVDAESYARYVTDRILPNMLPYIVGTPASFGFARWNGRSLTDNAPEVMFSFAANTAVSLGLTRESVAAQPSDQFPYVHAVPAAR